MAQLHVPRIRILPSKLTYSLLNQIHAQMQCLFDAVYHPFFILWCNSETLRWKQQSYIVPACTLPYDYRLNSHICTESQPSMVVGLKASKQTEEAANYSRPEYILSLAASGAQNTWISWHQLDINSPTKPIHTQLAPKSVEYLFNTGAQQTPSQLSALRTVF